MIHWGGLTLIGGESDFFIVHLVNFCEIQQSTWREGFGTGYTSNYATVNYTKLQMFYALRLLPIFSWRLVRILNNSAFYPIEFPILGLTSSC